MSGRAVFPWFCAWFSLWPALQLGFCPRCPTVCTSLTNACWRVLPSSREEKHNSEEDGACESIYVHQNRVSESSQGQPDDDHNLLPTPPVLATAGCRGGEAALGALVAHHAALLVGSFQGPPTPARALSLLCWRWRPVCGVKALFPGR